LENASLRRLETGTKGDRIVTAHAVRVRDKTPIVIRAEKYILALGGVETPRMLLLSAGKGPHREGLGNQGGQLGLHFNDHVIPLPFVTFDLARPVGTRLGFETMATEHFRIPSNRSEQPTFIVWSSPAVDWAPIQHDGPGRATRNGVLSLKNLREGISRTASFWGMFETEGTGRVELDKDRVDAFGSPVARVTLKLTEWDRTGLETFRNLIPKMGEALNAKHLSPFPPVLAVGFHPSGATAMGKNPDEGVCDPNLKVFGLENLYVVGNSVFPHMGANPPTLTIAALALRLGHHLEGKNRA
jgi:choline dehydrogenase-like flavoprotein